MESLRKIISSAWFRILLIAITVLIQAGILVFTFIVFNQYFAWLYAVCIIIAIIAVLHIVRDDSNPAYKIAWIIPIMLLPIFGGLLYVMFGKYRPTHKEMMRTQEVAAEYEKAMRPLCNSGTVDKLAQLDKSVATQAQYLINYAGAPLCQGTQSEYLPLGEDFFASLITELEKAEKFIFMEYFSLEPGKFWNAIEEVLVRKAAAGVDVRLTYDDVGCMTTVPANFQARMQSKGIQCCVFNKFTHIFNSRFNNRTHRKICVIDGNVGFTGGINLADEYINAIVKHGHWKDTAVIMRGQAVYSLTSMFLSVWDLQCGITEDFTAYAPTVSYDNEEGFVQPFTDTPSDGEAVGENVYMNMLNKAKKYVYITTPYLIIDNEMITSLSIAAKSGIDVRLITPGIPDKKMVYFLTQSFYEVLLKAGVKIYEYTPGFIHAKTAVTDDLMAVVGTINFDYRSLYLHHECAAAMYGTQTVNAVRDDFLATQAKCKEVTLDSVQHLSFIERSGLSVLRIFAPLM